MWPEILPSLAAVGGFVGLPALAMAGINYLAFGNIYQRRTESNYEYKGFLRDERITGDAFKFQGLEAIPDEDE